MTLRLLLLTLFLRAGHVALRLLRVRLHGPAVKADKEGKGAVEGGARMLVGRLRGADAWSRWRWWKVKVDLTGT